MNKFLLALVVIPGITRAQNSFDINGNITGLKEGSVVSLNNSNNPADTVARGVATKGMFQLKGSIDEPNVYTLNFHDDQKKTVLFIGNDKVDIKGGIDSVQNLVITGSPSQKDFDDFKTAFNPLFQRIGVMGQQINAKPDITQQDPMMIAYKKCIEQINNSVDSFIGIHKGSPVSPFVVLVTSQIEQEPANLEKRYASFDQKAKEGFYGKILHQQIEDGKTGAIGSDAIDFTQPTPDGKQVSLSSFKGKYVLVDFWASWCGPCRRENPNVVKAFNKFKDKNFTIMGVSLDKERAPWIKAIKDDKLAWTQVSDLKFWYNEAATKYKVQSIPQNFLIDPQGKIVGKNLRGQELEDRLTALLGSK